MSLIDIRSTTNSARKISTGSSEEDDGNLSGSLLFGGGDHTTTITARHMAPPNAGQGLKINMDGKIVLDVGPNSTVTVDSDDDLDVRNNSKKLNAASSAEDPHQLLEPLRGSWLPLAFKMPKTPIAEEADRKYCPPSLCGATMNAFNKEGVVVVFGGTVDSVSVGDTWIYNMVTKFWVQIPMASPSAHSTTLLTPPPRSGHCSASVRDIDLPLWRKDQELLREAQQFRQSVPTHIQKYKYNPQILIFGGADVLQRTYYNDVWEYEVSSQRWRLVNAGGTKPMPRWQCVCGVVELRMYVFGGEAPDYSLLGDLHMYDHNTEMWVTIRMPSVSPSPRTMHACAIVRDKMIVCGGIGTTPLFDTWVLDTRCLHWTKLDDPSTLQDPTSKLSPFVVDKKLTGLNGHVMTGCNQFVFLHGGKAQNKFSSQGWILDTKTWQWHKIAIPDDGTRPLPGARWRHCVAAMTEINPTKTMDLFLSLDEMQEQGIHLTEEKEMKGFIASLRNEAVQQRHFKGVLTSYYEKPYMSNTVSILIFGGVGFARMFCDLWRYTLPTVQIDVSTSTMLTFQDIEDSMKEEGPKRKGARGGRRK